VADFEAEETFYDGTHYAETDGTHHHRCPWTRAFVAKYTAVGKHSETTSLDIPSLRGKRKECQ
jgi:hypothetical protein